MYLKSICLSIFKYIFLKYLHSYLHLLIFIETYFHSYLYLHSKKLKQTPLPKKRPIGFVYQLAWSRTLSWRSRLQPWSSCRASRALFQWLAQRLMTLSSAITPSCRCSSALSRGTSLLTRVPFISYASMRAFLKFGSRSTASIRCLEMR